VINSKPTGEEEGETVNCTYEKYKPRSDLDKNANKGKGVFNCDPEKDGEETKDVGI
jgi:hypothetical protein